MQGIAHQFCRNPDGSWTCIEPATLEGPAGRIQVTPGSTFHPGAVYMGIDVAKWLDAELGGSARPCS